LKDPSAYYGLLPDSLVVIGIFSITKRQVSDSGFLKLRGFIDNSPYFRNEFPRSTKIDSQIDFKASTGTNIKVIPGCVAEGSLVRTPEGTFPIERLAQNAGTVWSATPDGSRMFPARFAGVMKSGMKACMELRTTCGYTAVYSESHAVKVLRGGKVQDVPLRDVCAGEIVFVVSDGETVGGVLPEAQCLQAVCADAEREAVSRDENLSGQTSPAAGQAQGVCEVPEAEACIRVRAEDSAIGFRPQDVLEKLVQSLRDGSGVQVLHAKQGGEATVRSAAAIFPGLEGGRAREVGELLRESSRDDSETIVVARVAFEVAGQRTPVQGCEPPQVSREVACVDRKESGEGSCDLASVSESATGAQGRISGHAYVVGCQVRDRVVWRKVLLLWDADVWGHRDTGSCGAVEQGGSNDGRELCALLSEMQCYEKCFTPSRVADPAYRSECGGNQAKTPQLRQGIVASVRSVGERMTYEVISVDSVSRGWLSSDILVRNSQPFHALGLDVFAYALDEANFMNVSKDKDASAVRGQAYEIYDNVRTRLKSRYMRPGGTIPGIMLLMSSKNTYGSFLEERINKAKSDPTAYVSDYALWEVKPPGTYTRPKFKVEVGDRMHKSRILGPDEVPRATARVVEVPGEFRREFQDDVDQALRDIAGQATYSISPFIHDRESVIEAFKPHLKHPFTRESVTVSVSGPESDVHLEDFFSIHTACRIVDSRWVPRLNPAALRYMHIDIGITGDCAGIGMGHMSRMVRRKRLRPDGTFHLERYPYIVFDFLLRVVPPPGDEIDLFKLTSFVLYLRQLYPIARVTFDGFQSTQAKQTLVKAGVESGIVSVDRDDAAYLFLRSAFSERRVALYRYPPFEDEIFDLERDVKKQKIDHPQRNSKGGKGSKDVTDAAAGVVQGCMMDTEAQATVVRDSVSEPDTEPDGSPSTAQVVAQGPTGTATVDAEWERLRRTVGEYRK
jgi:hypothetical protein